MCLTSFFHSGAPFTPTGENVSRPFLMRLLKMPYPALVNFKPYLPAGFALRANYLCNLLEFGPSDKYYDASIFQPTFNTFLASPGLG